ITFKADKTLVVDTELLETICEYSQHAQHLVGGKRLRLTPETLAKYAGTYEFVPGREAVLTVDGELLVLHLSASGETLVLWLESQPSLGADWFGEQVEFTKAASGLGPGLILRTGRGSGLGDRHLTEQKAVRKERRPP